MCIESGGLLDCLVGIPLSACNLRLACAPCLILTGVIIASDDPQAVAKLKAFAASINISGHRPETQEPKPSTASISLSGNIYVLMERRAGAGFALSGPSCRAAQQLVLLRATPRSLTHVSKRTGHVTKDVCTLQRDTDTCRTHTLPLVSLHCSLSIPSILSCQRGRSKTRNSSRRIK